MYGEKVKGLSQKGDKYGFVNETEIRIATGITLMLGLFSFIIVLFKGNFEISLYIIGLIWLDFLLKTLIGPKFSIFGIIVKIFIKNKKKKWVGSVQKRFAWFFGLILATFVLFCILLLGKFLKVDSPEVLQSIQTISLNIANNSLIVTPMNPAIFACALCIIFMWFESVVGYCIGCSIYKKLVDKGIMKKYNGQNCVDGSCEVK